MLFPNCSQKKMKAFPFSAILASGYFFLPEKLRPYKKGKDINEEQEEDSLPYEREIKQSCNTGTGETC